jgi:drug/metabolite transporter (DMT)-like permease
MSEKTFGVLAGLTAASIWGGMYVVSKVVLDIIPPFVLVSARLILGAGCLLVILAVQRGFKASWGVRASAVLVGLVGYGISLGLQFVGTKMSTAANASLVTSASPAFIFLFGALILKENVTLARLSALALATVGVVAVVDPRAASFGGQLFWGNIVLLGAALTWGLYSVLIKRVSAQIGVLELSFLAFLGGLPVSLSMGSLEWAGQGVGEITPGVVLGVLYLGLISTALAMYLWNKSLALLDAGIVSLLFFAQPIVGGGLGATVLGERLGVGYWVGAALIGGGLWVAARSEAMVRLPRGTTAQGVEES